VVGQWLRVSNGTIIGGVRSLSSDGRTANLMMIRSYFEPGSHEAQIPTSSLPVFNGRVIFAAGRTSGL